MVDLVGVAWENVLVGLLGGLIASLILFFARRVGEWSLQRRYPIAGEYLTKFEDDGPGGRFIATAPAILRQRGRKIVGVTSVGSRSWVLHGEISESGYLHGIYAAKDPMDRGVGNFFLRIHSDRHLEGLWSGYDSVNDAIAYGRYIFLPAPRGLEIRATEPDDTLALVRIADDQLGDGYLDEQAVAGLGSPGGFALSAIVDHRVVGFAIGVELTGEQVREIARSPLPRHLRLADRIGLLKTVAVAPSHHGRGIGTALTAAAVAEFKRRGIRALCSVAWRSPAGVNIKGVLERQGFTALAEIPDYWRAESEVRGFRCPACGDPPCTCSAVIYSHVV